MGKITGFLEYDRQNDSAAEPLSRIKNYNEFHEFMPAGERLRQCARCMDCGVPFCQSGVMLNGAYTGCPLHNLVPEWNDEVTRGNWDGAAERLLKTNCFPEFTGRVCPALCEAACSCGLYGESVTVKSNELAIIEHAFACGKMRPSPPDFRTCKTVAVIGSGPAGLAAAEMLNRRGHTVVVYERDDSAGGLLMYGIPNMKLDKKFVERRIELMKKEGIEFKLGVDVRTTGQAKKIAESHNAVAVCVGAKNPRRIDAVAGQIGGVHFAVDYLTSSTRSIINASSAQITAKDKNVIIVGGGDTGNDCVGTAIRQGAKSVIQLEMTPKLPDKRAETNQWPQWPRVCKTDYGQEEAIAVFGNDPRVYATTVKSIKTDASGCLSAVETIRLGHEKGGQFREVPGSEQILPAGLMLIAAGFAGAEKYAADAFGLKLNERGNIISNGYHAAHNIFTAGDARRGQSLVVWAIAEGVRCAEEIDKFLMGRHKNKLS